MQSTRDPKFGPEAESNRVFYAGVLAAALRLDPAAYLDYENFAVIPEVCWSGKRMLLTYVMREAAQNYGQTPAEAFLGVVSPSARLAIRRSQIAALESVLRTCDEEDKPWVKATIENLLAFWAAVDAGEIKVEAPVDEPDSIGEPAVPLKPIVWPFG